MAAGGAGGAALEPPASLLRGRPVLRVETLPAGRGRITKAVLVEGAGEVPRAGVTIEAQYTGAFPNGTVFDSSKKRPGNFAFPLGAGRVIAAWDAAFATMRKGEVCIITAPPETAYGKAGAGGVIPPDATLFFEAELVNYR